MTLDELKTRWTPEREVQERINIMIAARQCRPVKTSDPDTMARYCQPAKQYGPMPRLDTSLKVRWRRWWVDFWML